jgi:hypothetical protein
MVAVGLLTILPVAVVGVSLRGCVVLDTANLG